MVLEIVEIVVVVHVVVVVAAAADGVFELVNAIGDVRSLPLDVFMVTDVTHWFS